MRAMVRTFVVVFTAAVATVGCSSSDDDGPGRIVDAPDPPAGGLQIVSPTFTIPAGQEKFICMGFSTEITETLYVQSSRAYQAEGGHHTILFYTDGTAPMETEPHDCGDTDMTNVRFVGIGTGYGHGVDLPRGYVLEIPAGARLYAQSHYVNISGEDRLVQDVINLELVAADKVENRLGSYANVDLTFELPPKQQTTRTIECSPPEAINVPWILPHMHEWGTHMKVEIEYASGATETLWDESWDAVFRDDFPILDYEPHLQIGPDDVIRTTCTWQNTEDFSILFPKEMCATFMVYHPSANGALMVCDETGSNFEL